MRPEDLTGKDFESEFIFATSRSSGPGGQNVNKVNSRVELRFNVQSSEILTPEEKVIILEKLKNRINSEGELVLTSQSERTQMMNKRRVIEKFYELTARALSVNPERKPTSATRSSKLERLKRKKIRSSIKQLRKRSTDQSD